MHSGADRRGIIRLFVFICTRIDLIFYSDAQKSRLLAHRFMLE